MAKNNSEDKINALRMAGTDQVIVLKDDDESKKPGALSWNAIGRHLNRFKYWVIGVTLLSAIIGYVVIQYMYNPSHNAFTATFSLDLKQTASVDDPLKGKLLNDDSYDVRDIVKIKNLKKTIENEHNRAVEQAKDDYLKANGSLDGFDESKIQGKYDFFDKNVNMNGLLNIVAYTTKETEPRIIANTYVLSGRLAYFNKTEIASSFINDAIKSYANELEENYSLPEILRGFDDMNKDYGYYDRQVDILNASYEAISSGFERLRNNFSAAVRLKDGQTTLEELIRSFNNASGIEGGLAVKGIVAEQENTGYVKGYNDDEADKAALLKRYQDLERSLVLPNFDEAKLKKEEYVALVRSIGKNVSEAYMRYIEEQLNSWNIKYEQYLHQKILIGSRLKAMGDTTQGAINPEESGPYRPAVAPDISQESEDEFAKRMDVSKEALKEWSVKYIDASKYLLFESTQIVFYHDSERIILTQAISSYLGALGGAFLGFVISAFVVVAVGQGQRKKQLYLTGIDPIDVYELPTEQNPLAETPSNAGKDVTKKKETKGGRDENAGSRGNDESTTPAVNAKSRAGDERAKRTTNTKGAAKRKKK